jgi:hypothetical protein
VKTSPNVPMNSVTYFRMVTPTHATCGNGLRQGS